MTGQSFITTSWDDGHPLDLRVADRLAKYGLRGTFYVPASGEHPRMSAAELRRLASGFEIGAHTLHHLDLTRASEGCARREIVASKAWIEDSTGKPCRMFCPPLGRFSARHLGIVREAGYLGLRSVELCSLARPRRKAGVMLMPTTVQAFPHKPAAFYRNALKRGVFRNLWRYLACRRAGDWPKLAAALLRAALGEGGIFHLWGHSWDVEETGQWQQLDAVLRLLGETAQDAPPLTNAEICMLAPFSPWKFS